MSTARPSSDRDLPVLTVGRNATHSYLATQAVALIHVRANRRDDPVAAP